MNLHSIPKEVVGSYGLPFYLAEDQIKAIRAYRRDFRQGGIGVWVKDGVAIDIGWDNRDGREPGRDRDFVKWPRNELGILAWADIFDSYSSGGREFPEFDPAWIQGFMYVT